MIAASFPRIHDLLQDLVRITQRFIASNEPLLEFLEHDEYFSAELMAWFQDYDVTEGHFTLSDFIPGGCIRGMEVRFVHVKEAEGVVQEAIEQMKIKYDYSPALLSDWTFEQEIIDFLQESLRFPSVVKDITQMERDLLSALIPSAIEKYPALSTRISYTNNDFRMIINQMMHDIRYDAKIPDSQISKVAEFIRALHCCANECQLKLPDAQQGNLFT